MALLAKTLDTPGRHVQSPARRPNPALDQILTCLRPNLKLCSEYGPRKEKKKIRVATIDIVYTYTVTCEYNVFGRNSNLLGITTIKDIREVEALL